MSLALAGSVQGQTFTLTAVTGPAGSVTQFSYTLLKTGDTAGTNYGPYQQADLPLAIGPLSAGEWSLTVLDADTGDSGTRQFTIGAASGGCDLVLTGPTATAPTAQGQNGQASYAVATSAPGVVDILVLQNGRYVYEALPDGNGRTQPIEGGLPPGTYDFQAKDGNGCVVKRQFVVPEYPISVRRGCTDPAATNYDPQATQDDGSCTYTPAVRVPYFEVPLGQSLRFVQPGRADRPAFDNTLLADEAPLDFTVAPYCQLVEQADTLVLQVLSNYGQAPVLQLYPAGSNTARGTSYPGQRVQQGAGTTAAFPVYLKPDVVAGRTRVYFNEDALPLPFLAGQRVSIGGTTTSLDGTYPIHDVLEDVAAAVPYLVITGGYPTGTIRLDGSLTTTYVVQAYDTYQVVVPFAGVPRGCYQARFSATDPDFPDALAVSEPLEVEATQPGTLLIAYRNFDNDFGFNYSHGLVHRLRVKGRFFQRQDATLRTVERNDDNALVLLKASVQRKVQLEALLLPGYLHEALTSAFAHDFVSVQAVRVVLEGDYAFEPVERFTLSRGTALLERVEAGPAVNRDDLGDVDQGGGPFLRINGSRLAINP